MFDDLSDARYLNAFLKIERKIRNHGSFFSISQNAVTCEIIDFIDNFVK